MNTVNLETELIKANRKIVNDRQLLLIREFERVGEIDNSVLERVGIRTLSEAKTVISRNKKLFDETKEFKQERVFHISQIEKVCKDYCLRFLPSESYIGAIDDKLPMKISNFEAAHNIRCISDKKGNRTETKEHLHFTHDGSFYREKYVWETEFKMEDDVLGMGHYTPPNTVVIKTSTNYRQTFIAAPAESFQLEERDKDPLFFVQLNEEYYYLIHKWGTDLSVHRKWALKLASTGALFAIIPVLWAALMFLIDNIKNTGIDWTLSIIVTLACMCAFIDCGYYRDYALTSRNFWNSNQLMTL